MGEFELYAGLMYMDLLSPQTTPLWNAYNVWDITTATGWTNCQFTTRLEVAGSLLFQRAFILCDYTVTDSVTYLPGNNNILAYAASCR